MDTHVLIIIGGCAVVSQGVVTLGVGLLRDYLGGKQKHNGHCADHAGIQATLEILVESAKDERKEELMERAMTKALKKNKL